jgi:GNAT superfamily N-acetyltransferase
MKITWDDISTHLVYCNMKNISIKIYTHSEFYEIVYGNGGCPKFPKLEQTIRYFSFKDLCYCYDEETRKNREGGLYIVMYDKSNIIGIIRLGLNTYIKSHKQLYISYFSIDEKYQGKGLSYKMLDILFHYSKENNIILEGSTRTDKGKERLGKNIDRYAIDYDVKYIPSEFNYHFL